MNLQNNGMKIYILGYYRAGTNVRGANVIALPSASASVLASALAAWDKSFNLGHNFQTIKDRAFIFHMCIPFDKTFHLVP